MAFHGVLRLEALPVHVFNPAADLLGDVASGRSLHLADHLGVRASFLRLRALGSGRLCGRLSSSTEVRLGVRFSADAG